jgi:hypothetical protein
LRRPRVDWVVPGDELMEEEALVDPATASSASRLDNC